MSKNFVEIETDVQDRNHIPSRNIKGYSSGSLNHIQLKKAQLNPRDCLAKF